MTVSYPSTASFTYSSPDSSRTLEVHNPATGKLITTLRVGDASTTEQAIKDSHKAFETDWRWRTATERGVLLLKCAEKLEENKEELAELLCMENGKPKQDALSYDVTFLVGVFRYFGSLVDKLPTEFYDRGSVYTSVVREPHGVCAGILPFNWPPIHCGGKLAPALAAGNTMIMKPGEQAPLCALRIIEIVQSVLPKDVVIAVPGNGPEVPQTLVTSPTVKMVSFTGSTNAGKAVSKTAAPQMKHLALELGGKNAFIIFEDVDINRAVRDALEGAFFNKGEACTAASRLLVHEKVYDEFVTKLGNAVKNLRAGNGMDSSTHVGPAVSKAQQERVLSYLDIATKEGAKIAAQAQLPSDPACKDGYFVQPTLFRDVKRKMRCAQEEMFGPLVTACAFSDEEEAISIANESPYGLVAAVYTKDMEKGMRVSRRLESGMVFFNNYFRNILGLPFGGVKESGYGREHCIETLKEWSTSKFIQFPSGRTKVPEWRGVGDVFTA